MDNNLLWFWILLLCLSLGCSNEVQVPSEDCPAEIAAPSCVCDAVYDPVCGCNAKTYGNICEVLCSGIDNYVKGECP